jgi:hypothetical protein
MNYSTDESRQAEGFVSVNVWPQPSHRYRCVPFLVFPTRMICAASLSPYNAHVSLGRNYLT